MSVHNTSDPKLNGPTAANLEAIDKENETRAAQAVGDVTNNPVIAHERAAKGVCAR